MQDAICGCKKCSEHRVNVTDVEAPFGISTDFTCKDCVGHKAEQPKAPKKKEDSK